MSDFRYAKSLGWLSPKRPKDHNFTHSGPEAWLFEIWLSVKLSSFSGKSSAMVMM